MKHFSKLDGYRDTITAIFRKNMLAIANDEKWGQTERAGTAMLAACSAIGGAAAAWQAVHPHLTNAPREAVLRDMMEAMTEVLCKPAPPHLSIVTGEPRNG